MINSWSEGRPRGENSERLALGFKQDDEYYALTGLTSEERQLKAGQKLDVGDVKLKRVR